jgi:hypothetical protein
VHLGGQAGVTGTSGTVGTQHLKTSSVRKNTTAMAYDSLFTSVPVPLVRALIVVRRSRRSRDSTVWQAALFVFPPKVALVAESWPIVRHTRVRVGIPARSRPTRWHGGLRKLRHAAPSTKIHVRHNYSKDKQNGTDFCSELQYQLCKQ